MNRSSSVRAAWRTPQCHGAPAGLKTNAIGAFTISMAFLRNRRHTQRLAPMAGRPPTTSRPDRTGCLTLPPCSPLGFFCTTPRRIIWPLNPLPPFPSHASPRFFRTRKRLPWLGFGTYRLQERGVRTAVQLSDSEHMRRGPETRGMVAIVCLPKQGAPLEYIVKPFLYPDYHHEPEVVAWKRAGG